jgi:hypothetical protein
MNREIHDFEHVDGVLAVLYRTKTPAERLRLGFGLWKSANIILTNCLRSLHPDWDLNRIQKEVARRMSLGAI